MVASLSMDGRLLQMEAAIAAGTVGQFASANGSRRSMVSHRDASGLARAARGMLTQRDAGVIELLPNIRVPSLVMVSADDAPFLAVSDYIAAKIPGAKKVVIPAAGHAVNIDAPRAFIEAVLPFLDSLPHSAMREGVFPS
jgi:pimeloyl-ACP methyl ester carboxylesterase